MIEIFNKFIYLFTELTILFLGISFLIGIIQQTISEEKIRSMLSTKNKFLGYVNALILGTFTPFCSCSTVPVLVGLTKVKAPFGPTMTFLFTSPFLDPAVVVLMLALFGVKITVVYSAIVLMLTLIIGILLEKLGFEKYVKNVDVKKSQEINLYDVSLNLSRKELIKKYLIDSAKDALKLYISVLPYLIIGVLIGSLMYNVVPQDVIAKYVGDDNLWAVPIAAILGIPLYLNSTTILPIGVALSSTGIGLGPIIALIIGGTGASIPEIILLNKLFKKQLIITFIVATFVIAISAGYLVQFIM
ncbi:permease [Clostridioides sp. ZZV14-6345]|uniref:permease n=1 Tax=Clostridioides sp. ZZV14-6345 TaxID=2811496 RepID=UPI001D12861D|nr:permease [Clostridioides sp. ZZV14-6345]